MALKLSPKGGTSNVEITVIKQNVANIQAQLCKHGEKIRADLPIAQDRQAKRHTPDQQAVIALAKEAKASGGLSLKEAKILLEFAREYDIPHHGPEHHINRKQTTSQNLHIHVGSIGHISITDEA